MAFLKSLFGTPEEKLLKSWKSIVERTNALESSLEDLLQEELSGKTTEFKERLEKGETLDDILPEAYATVREAAKRTLGQRHFDVQILGGIALYKGGIAEMKTGEGKTLVATLCGWDKFILISDYLSEYSTIPNLLCTTKHTQQATKNAMSSALSMSFTNF